MKGKNARKLAAILLASVILVALLAGCGQTSSNEGKDTQASSMDQTSSTQTASTKAELPEVTIKMYFPGDNTPFDKDVWANVEAMSKNVLNAKFEISHIAWNDYSDKIKLLLTSGDDYDMHFDANWFVYPALVKNGSLLELDALMDKYAPNLKKYLQDRDELVWAQVNGKIMAVPCDNPNSQRPFIMIRDDLRTKYNLPDKMTTIEDLNNYIDGIMKNEKGILPLNNIIQMNMWDNALYAMSTKYSIDREFGQSNYDFTYSLTDSKVNIVPLERTPAFKEASQIRRTWYEKGWIPKNALNASENVYNLDQGKYAATVRGVGDSYAPMKGPGTKKAYMMYPDNVSSMSGSMGNIMCFNKNAKNPERDMMFLEWVSASQENYNAVLYGIEGKTYVKKQENGVDTIQYPDGQDSKSGYLDWAGRWAFWKTQWRLTGFELTQESMDAQKMDSTYAKNMVPPLAGFTFNTEPVKTEIANRQAVIEQYGKMLMYGLQSDVDKAVSEYITKMNEAGTDKIVAELQKQVDAFLASKK